MKIKEAILGDIQKQQLICYCLVQRMSDEILS